MFFDKHFGKKSVIFVVNYNFFISLQRKTNRKPLAMKHFALLFLLTAFAVNTFAQPYSVDKQGVLRDSVGNECVFFGFNYCMPFAHGYRMHQRLGIAPKAAIDRDVYHMARLGANAFRVHVWDVEISDEMGNLLENDHLDLLDYTIAKFAERGVKTLITGIAFWGNGWPEPDDRSLQGFSNKTPKNEATWNKATVDAHERYLTQLLQHRNPYTGCTYATDPNIVAVEINNEPSQTDPKRAKELTAYVNRMAKAIRKTGCKKPILYNVAENASMIESYLAANIDGVTFQWYPSGLVSGHARTENFLPLVEHYRIPFADKKGFSNKARFVYEFDAADIFGSYIYPAMARSFREVGFQWATMFAYDPFAIAHINTDYNTHYLNIAFTPQKAISYRIATEAFRHLPRWTTFGDFPANSVFADFSVDYNQNLSLLNCDTIFAYSNSTDAQPKNADKLAQIAGYGSSPVAQYDGSGAYFLDKVCDGGWRLEVYPDAMLIDNPFRIHNSEQRTVAVLKNDTHTMRLALPDLAHRCRLVSERGETEISCNSFAVTPGVYLLLNHGIDAKTLDKIGNFGLFENFALPTNCDKIYLTNAAAKSWTVANQTIEIHAIAPENIDSIVLIGGMKWGKPLRTAFAKTDATTWRAKVEKSALQSGIFEYNISVFSDGKVRTFPDDCAGLPSDWNYTGLNTYKTVLGKHTAFNAENAPDEAEIIWRQGIEIAYLPDAIRLSAGNGYEQNAGIQMGVCRHDLTACQRLTLTANTSSEAKISIVLTDKNGRYFVAKQKLTRMMTDISNEIAIALDDFAPCAALQTRAAYPWFAFAPTATTSSEKPIAGDLTSVVVLLESGTIDIKRIEFEE